MGGTCNTHGETRSSYRKLATNHKEQNDTVSTITYSGGLGFEPLTLGLLS